MKEAGYNVHASKSTEDPDTSPPIGPLLRRFIRNWNDMAILTLKMAMKDMVQATQ